MKIIRLENSNLIREFERKLRQEERRLEVLRVNNINKSVLLELYRSSKCLSEYFLTVEYEKLCELLEHYNPSDIIHQLEKSLVEIGDEEVEYENPELFTVEDGEEGWNFIKHAIKALKESREYDKSRIGGI